MRFGSLFDRASRQSRRATRRAERRRSDREAGAANRLHAFQTLEDRLALTINIDTLPAVNGGLNAANFVWDIVIDDAKLPGTFTNPGGGSSAFADKGFGGGQDVFLRGSTNFMLVDDNPGFQSPATLNYTSYSQKFPSGTGQGVGTFNTILVSSGSRQLARQTASGGGTGQTSTTVTTTAGSPVVTGLSAAQVARFIPGMTVSGGGFSTATVLNVDAINNQLTLNANASALGSGAGVTLSFQSSNIRFIEQATEGSPVVTLSSTDSLVVGSQVTGPGIPTGTILRAIDSATRQVTLSNAVTQAIALLQVNGNTTAGTGVIQFAADPANTFVVGMTLSGGGFTNAVVTNVDSVNNQITVNANATAAGAGNNRQLTYLPFQSLPNSETTSGSATVTVGSTANLSVGGLVYGTNIPAGAFIRAITSSTQFTLSANATGTANNTTLSIVRGGSLQVVNALVRQSQGVYRYYLPQNNPHKLFGTVNTSNGSFDYAYYAPARGIGLGNPTQLTIGNVQNWNGAVYVTPTSSNSSGFWGVDTNGNWYLEFRFYDAVATGNPTLDMASVSVSNQPYNYSKAGTIPQSFTITAGQDLTTRLLVDFSVPGSTVTIGSPLAAAGGTATAGFLGSAYFTDDITFYTSTINIQQTTTTSQRMRVGATDSSGRLVSPLYETSALQTSSFNVDAATTATSYTIGIDGALGAPGAMTVTSKGSLTATSFIDLFATYSNLRFLGTVSTGGGPQNYFLRGNDSNEQYEFTTRTSNSLATGTITAGTLTITGSQPKGGLVDLTTAVNKFRFDSGTSNGLPFAYDYLVSDSGDLTVDAVASTSGTISLAASGALTLTGSAVQSMGDLALKAGSTLTVNGIITTSNGNVTLDAPSLSLGSSVSAGGSRGVSLVSQTGGVSSAALVQAGGTVKQTVRAASEKAYTLANLFAGQVFDGLTLAVGDRILLSRQAVSAENGIYVVRAANLTPQRASDASSSSQFPQGFVVPVREGSQRGLWTFRNDAVPVLGTSPLLFVPASATRVYENVRAATTAAIGVLSGPARVATTGDLANGSAVVTNLATTAGLQVGMTVTGSGIVAGTTIQTVDSATQVTLSQPVGPVAGGAGVALTLTLTGLQVARSGNLSTATAAVTLVGGTAGLQAGMTVDGEGIAAGTTILSVNAAANQVTLSAIPTATVPAAALSFGQTLVSAVGGSGGDRILVKNQANPAQNGIYVYDASGAWVRASDADSIGELTAGGYVYVREAAVNGTLAFALDNDVTQVGITAMTFSPFATQTTRTNTWSPAAVLADAAVATTANTVLSGLQTIDGVTLTAGMRVLVKNQNDASRNGVYEAAALAWTRATDADTGAEMPRGTAIYVTNGTQGRNTTWQFDDSSRMRATTTADTSLVTGLASTANLQVGMLVSGPGIPSGTTIQSIPAGNASIRLSTNAKVSGAVSLTFMKTTAVNVGVDPLPFIPVGGALDVTSATTIGGTGRLQGATALLTAGTVANASTSTINILTNAGRASLTAPGAITVSNSSSLEVESASTTHDGAVTIAATGTLTALSISASSTGGARPVALSSQFGDVVAEAVTAEQGDITLTSANGGIAFTKARFATANVSAVAGSVFATADAAGAVITVDGRVLAQGVGSDVVLSSNNGMVTFTGNAVVTAADQLKINTPNSTPTVGAGASITAARLSLTAQFAPLVKSYTGVTTNGSTSVTNLSSAVGLTPGMAVYGAGIPAGTTVTAIVGTTATLSAPATATTTAGSPASLTFDGLLPPLGTYQTVDLNRTDAGSLVYTSASSLTVEGATTSDGPITITAPDVTVPAAGAIISRGTAQDVKLVAAAGNLRIDGTVTSTRDVDLQAPAGEIGGGLTQSLAATLVAGSARATVASTAALAVGMRVSGTGIPASTYVVSVDSATQVTLSNAATAAGTPTLTFTSTTGLLTAQRNVSLVASTAARVTVQAAALSSATLSAANAFLGVSSAGALPITAVTLSNSGTAAFGIGSAAVGGGATVGSIDAGSTGTVVLSAYGNILGATADATADVKAKTVTLVSTIGKIVLDTDIDFLTATAQQKNQSISINDLGASGLELTSVGSGSATSGVDVGVTAKGPITATSVLTAGKVTLATSNAGADILVNSIVATGNVVDLQAKGSIKESPIDAGADITATTVQLTAVAGSIGDPASPLYLAASGVTATATTNGQTVTLKNDTALAIGTSDVRTMTLAVGGVVTQTGIVKADTLSVSATSGSNIALDTQNNQIGTFSATSLGAGGVRGNVAVKDVDAGLVLGAIVAATATIDTSAPANGPLTQGLGAAIDATSLVVAGNGGAITLMNGGNKVGTFKATNGVGAISLAESDLGLVLDNVTGGAVTIDTSAGAGGITQAAGSTVNAATLGLKGNGGGILLTNTGNQVGTFGAVNAASANGAGDISLTEGNLGLILDTIVGGTVTVNTAAGGGTIVQAIGAGIVATTLDVTGNGQQLLITPSAAVTPLATLVAASQTVTVANTANLRPGNLVAGAGIPAGTTIASVDSATQLTLSAAATTGGTNVPVTFTPVNKIGTFKASNGLAGTIKLTESDQGLVLDTIVGGSVTIDTSAGNGGITQASGAAITATTLDITGNGGAITLNASPVNATGDVVNGQPSVRSISGGTAGLRVGMVVTGAGIPLGTTVSSIDSATQVTLSANATATVNGVPLVFTPVNKVGTFRAVNAAGNVSLVESDQGLQLDTIVGGTVTINTAAGNGPIAQVAGKTITAAMLDVTGNGQAITITNVGNVIGSFQAANGTGGISLIAAPTAGLVLGTITGGNVSIDASAGTGTITQSAAATIAAATLSVAGNGSNIVLGNAGNAVDAFTATNVVGATRGGIKLLSSTGTLTVNSVTGGFIEITSQGTLTAAQAITAGTAAQDPYPTGDITLRSLTGNVVVNAPLSAVLDTVTLDASKGVIQQNLPGGTIDAGTVIWYATLPFTVAVVGASYVEGPNLTAPGPLSIIRPGKNLTIAGASTLDGPVTVQADSVTITRLVQAGGSNDVTITASTGSIAFTDQGRVVADGGNVTLTATAVGGTVTADNTATYTTVSAGATAPTAGLFTLAVDTSGQTNTGLKTAVNVLDATAATAGSQLAFSQAGAIQLGKNGAVSTGAGGSVTLTATGAVTQGKAISTGTLAVTTTAGGILLTNIANDVAVFSGSAAAQAVSYTDATGFQVAAIAGSPVTLVAGGAVTQTGAITGGGALAVTATGAVTLTSAGNDAGTVAIDAGGNAVSYTDASGFQVTAITGGSVTLGAGGAITQTGAITGGGALAVTASGAVTLTSAGNDAGTVAIAAGANAVSYTDVDAFQVAGIAGAPVTLVAGGAITQGVGNAAAITGGGTLTITAGGNVTLGNPANDAGVLTAALGTNSLSYSDFSGFQVGGITAATAILTAGGAVTQPGTPTAAAIQVNTLSVTAVGGAVTLPNSANDVTNLTVNAAGQAVSYTDANTFVVNGLTGASIALSGGGITQGTNPTDAIVATGRLTVTNMANGVTLDNAGNDVATLSITAANQAIKYVDQTGFQVNGLTGSAIDLTAGGTLSQDTVAGAKITATGQLTVTNVGGGTTLTNVDNDVATLAVNAAGQPVSYFDFTTLAVAGIRGTAISLTATELSQALAAGNEIVGNSLTVDTGTGAASLANPLNDIGSLQILSAGAATYTDASGFAVSGIAAASATLVAAGTVTQGVTAADKIVVPGLFDLKNTAGSVTLGNPANNFGTLKIDAGSQGITVSDVDAVVLSTLTGGAITLTAGGAVTQTAGTAITGAALSVTAGGAVTLQNTGNDVQSLSVTAPVTSNVSYVDASGFAVAGITGAAVTLTGNGPITQTGAIAATSLTLSDPVGPIVLDNAANAVGTLSVTAAGQAFTYVDAAALSITSITAGAITLTSGGALTQTGAITGTSLSITNTGGGVTLTNASNDVQSLAVNAGSNPVTYRDATGFAVNGITGSTIALQAAGQITQAGGPTAAIIGSSLTVTNSASVVLDNPANDVATLQITAQSGGVGQPVTYTDATALTVAGVTGSVVALSSGGALSQTGPIAATTSLSMTNTGGGVVLTDANNRTPALSVFATGQAVQYQDKLGFQVNGVQAASIKLYAGGAITQGTGAANAIAGGIPLFVQSTAGNVTLDNPANDVSTLTVLGTAAVTFVGSTAYQVDGLTGTALALTAGGGLTQGTNVPADAILGTSLSITNTAGPTTLTNSANKVGVFSIVGTGQAVAYEDAGDLVLGGVSGSSATITVAGKLTQAVGSKLAVAGLLTVTGGTGDVTLTNTGNDVGSLSIAAPGRAVSYADASGFVVNGITAATVSLAAAGAVTQGTLPADAILATALSVTNTTGGVLLGNAANDVASVSISAAGQSVTYVDATAVDVAAGGVQGSVVALTAAGNITQTGAVSGSSLTATSTAGGIALATNPANDFATVALQASGQAVAYRDATGFQVAGIQGAPVTLTAGGAITQAAGPSAAIATGAAGSLTVNTTAGGVVLGNTSNDIGTLTVTAAGQQVTYTDANDFVVNGITGTTITLAGGGAITQLAGLAASISGTALAVTNSAGGVTLDNPFNKAGVLAVTALSQPVTYFDSAAVSVAGITGQAIVLNTGGAVTQTGTIAGQSLTVTTAIGGVSLTSATNDVTDLTISAPGQAVAYTDANGFVVKGVNGAAVTLVGGGAITQGSAQGEAITATSLSVTNTASIKLDNAFNAATAVTLIATGHTVTYVDSNGFAVNGLQGTTMSLTANGPVTQGGGVGNAIVGTSLSVSNSAGGVLLGNVANDVGSLAIIAPAQTVSYVDSSGFAVNGLTGSTITLTGAGAITQGTLPADAIAGGSLSVSNTAGGVVLANTANDVTSVQITASGQTVTYVDASDLSVTGITGGTNTLTAGGLLTQTGAITGTSLDVTNTGGAVLLTNAGNRAGTLRIQATGQTVTYRDSAGFVVKGIAGATIALVANGAVTQGTAPADAIAGGTLTVTNTGDAVTLDNPLNDLAAISIAAGTQGLTYADSNGFTVNGLTTGAGGPITLVGGGAITQGATAADAIVGTALKVTNPLGGVTLDNPANDVQTLSIAAAGQAVVYADKGGFAVDGIVGSTISLSAAGPLTQATGAAAAITGKGLLTVVNTGGPVTLGNPANDVATLSVKAVSPTSVASAVTFVNSVGFTVDGITAAGITLTGGGAIGQAGGAAAAIFGTALSVTASGAVVLDNAANEVMDLGVTATVAGVGQTVTYVDSSGFNVTGITGGAISLTAAGVLSQTGAITGSSLSVTDTAGPVTLTLPGNDVASLTVNAAGQAVSYTDASGFTVNGLKAATLVLTAAGAVTQGGLAGDAIAATSLSVKTTSGGVVLGNPANEVGKLGVTATGQTVTYVDASGFDVTGIAGGAISLTAAGPLTQSGAITGTSLSVTGTGGDVTLTNAANDVQTVAIAAAGQAVAYTDASGFIVAGIQGGSIALAAKGVVSQGPLPGNAIVGTSLSVANGAGGTTLDNPSNNVASLAVSAAGQAFTYVDADGLVVNGITANAVNLSANGLLTQGPLTADRISAVSLVVSNPGGSVVLDNAANAVGTLSVNAGLVSSPFAVTYVDADGLVVDGIVGGTISLTAKGPVTQGAAASARISGGSLSVTNTNGPVTLDNQFNDVVSLAVAAVGQPVTFTDSSGLVVDGIAGSAIKLTVGGPLTQTGSIRGSSLAVTSTAGGVTLEDAANDVGSLAIAAPGQQVAYRDATGFVVNGLTGVQFNLTAGGAVTQGATAADRIQATWLLVNDTTGGVVLANPANDVYGLVVTAPGQDVSYADAGDFMVYGLTGGAIKLAAGGAITQDSAPWSAIQGTSLSVAAAGGATLNNPANAVETLTVDAAGQTVNYLDADGLIIGGVTAAVLSLITNGPVTQTGSIAAGVLSIVNGSGGVSLPSASNDVISLRIIAPGQPVVYNDASGFLVVGLQGSTVTVTAAGPITQDAASYSGVIATTLSVTDTGGTVTLDNPTNDVDGLSISAPSRGITYVDATGFAVNGLNGSDVTLRAAGPITQGLLAGNAITATTLSVTDTAGGVSLTNTGNSVTTLAVAAAGQPVSFAAKAGFAVGGIRGSAISLAANGAISQAATAAAAIVGSSLSVTNTAGGVVLGNAANDVQSLAIANGTRAVTYTDAGGFTVAGVTGGTVVLNAAGTIDQAWGAAAVVVATALTVNDTAGPVYLTNPANDAGTVTFNTDGQVVVYADATGFTIGGIRATSAYLTAAGAVTQAPQPGNAIVGTFLSLTDSSGDVTLGNISNDVQYLAIANAGRGVTYVDATGFVVQGLSGGSISLTAAGDIYQSADVASAVTGTALSVTNAAGVVVLDNKANDVTSVTVANGSRTVVYTDGSGVVLGSMRGGAIYLTVGGPLTQTAALVGSVLSVTVGGGGGAVVLDNPGNDVDWLSVANAGRAVTYADKSGFTIFGASTVGLAGSAVRLTAGGDVMQTAAITAASLAVTATAGSVTLTNAANDSASVAIANAGRAVSYTDATGFDVAGISGSPITLVAAGDVTQSAAVTGGTLALTSTAGTAVKLTAAGNDVTGLAVTAPGQTVTYADATGFTVNGIRAASVSLTAAGAIGQATAASAAIVAPSLSVVNGAGGVILGNAANDVGTLFVGASGQSVAYTDAGSFSVVGITANAISLVATGGITQAGPMSGGSLTVANTGGAVALDSPANDLASVAIANGTGAVSYADSSAVALGAVSGGTVSIATGGGLTQTAALTATTLSLSGAAGNMVLDNAKNAIGSVAVSNPGRAVTLVDSTGLALAGITAGSVSVSAAGNVTQTAPVLAESLSLNVTGGSATLGSAGNVIGQLAASIPTAKAGLTVQNTGSLAITQVSVAGAVKIGTTGDLRVGPAGTPNPLLKSDTSVNLAGVTGQVILQNGGRIVAPSGTVTLPAGQTLQISVTTADGLSTAITQANTLKVPTTVVAPGGTQITLSAPLPAVTSPIAFVGSGATILGSAAVPVGFAFTSTAAGCSITGFTLQGFATAAVRLTGVSNVRIDGVSIVNSGIGLDASGNLAGSRVINSTFTNNTTGARLTNATNLVFGSVGAGNRLFGASTGTGLLVSGTSTGTTARANSFSGYGTGVSLSAATGLVVGGSGAGEFNTVSSAARAGVFATGICTGSTVAKTQFFTTPTPYNTGAARGLTVIR